jgi:hypothetical protein
MQNQTFDEWLEYIQGKNVNDEIYNYVSSRINLNLPYRLFIIQIKSIINNSPYKDDNIDIQYIADYFKGNHQNVIPLDTKNMILSYYAALYTITGEELEQFSYSYILQKIAEELKISNLFKFPSIPNIRKREFDINWTNMISKYQD